MLERTTNLEIDKAYSAIKTAFTEKGCRIISEQSPNRILLSQGSLWGIFPSSAKKKIQVNLESVSSVTKVGCSSNLSSDWKKITLIGCILAALLVCLCLWIAFDLSAFLANGKASFWSWLVTVNGNVDFQVGLALINLTRTLVAFLSVVILLEIAISVYVYGRVDRFAEQILNYISG